MATAVNICLHFKLGHCKYQDTCTLQHIKELCDNRECDVTNCSLRHPRRCRFWNEYYRCKFGSDCSYLHKSDDNYYKKSETFEEELEVIKVKIDSLAKKVSEKVNEIAKATKDEIVEYIEQRLSNKIEHLQLKVEEAMYNNTRISNSVSSQSPGINTDGDSAMDANSQGSPAGNDEEEKSGKN